MSHYVIMFVLVTAAESRPRISQTLLLASQTTTPRLTPPGSPPLSGATSPLRTSKPVSPKRHSMSFSTSRGFFEDRSSMSSTPLSSHSSIGSDAGSQAGQLFHDFHSANDLPFVVCFKISRIP